MKRQWILILLVALVSGALAFAVTRRAVCRADRNPADGLRDLSFLTRELNLSAAQVRQIKALHTTLGARLNDCCARHCAARARLGEALAAGAEDRTEAVLKEMCRTYEDSERAALTHIREMRAILSAEQQKRFDAMIAKCMCRNCGEKGQSHEEDDHDSGCGSDAGGVRMGLGGRGGR